MSAEERRAYATNAERVDTEHRTELRPTESRQAVTGVGLRYVLIVGLALVVIAFAIIYFLNF
ncbi:MAG TPA: hypothetical protein VGK90_11865 [Rhizomicrobium sp.]|jgi:cobalamin biosynthesis Mg chelatase CobN